MCDPLINKCARTVPTAQGGASIQARNIEFFMFLWDCFRSAAPATDGARFETQVFFGINRVFFFKKCG